MCLIVDANVANRVFLVKDDPDFKDLHASIFASRKPLVKVVYGGKLVAEYQKSHHNVIRLLLQLNRAGRAKRVDDALIKSEYEKVIQKGVCRSNDTHIIALARADNVRLLCSHDKDLGTDFKNKALLDNPRGKVYKNSKHNKLLQRLC